MDFPVIYPFDPIVHFEEQRHQLHNTYTLDHHHENVMKIEAVVFELAAGNKTQWEMRNMVDIPMGVLNKQIGWFGMHGFHCLRYLGHPAGEIFNSIAGGFQSLDPGLSRNAARTQAIQTHKILGELAAGTVLSEIARRRRWTGEVAFQTINLRMATYCLHVSQCIQQLGISRSTLHNIMANVQMGIPLKQVFLEMGMPEALRSARALLATWEYPVFAPHQAFDGYSDFIGDYSSESDFNLGTSFRSEDGCSYFSSDYTSSAESEYTNTTEDSLCTELTGFSSEFAYQGQVGSDIDPPPSIFYSWNSWHPASLV